MTRRQKISLVFFIELIVIILLSVLIANGQYYQLNAVSGHNYKKLTTLKNSFIRIEKDSVIILNTEYEKDVFTVKRKFTIRQQIYYEVETLSGWTFIWAKSHRSTDSYGRVYEYGEVIINRRYSYKAEENNRYRHYRVLKRQS